MKYKKGDKVTLVDLNAPCEVVHVTPHHEDGDKLAVIFLKNVVNKIPYSVPVANQDTDLKPGHPERRGALSGQVEAQGDPQRLTIFQRIFGNK